MIAKWMFNCREVNRMISAGMDADLPLLQRILIRFHLMMCRRCNHVRKQLISLRDYSRHLGSDGSAMDDWVQLSPEIRQRIKVSLQTAQIDRPEPDLGEKS